MFLLLHLVSYIHNINVFKKELNTLEDAHDFMEDVLELRRYEKNFVFRIDSKDIEEVLDYLKKIKKKINQITSNLEMIDDGKVKAFHNDLMNYEHLINLARERKEFRFNEIRRYGQNMVMIAQNILDISKSYIDRRLNKILIIPTIVVFLFGLILIVLLIILAVIILRQMAFIQKATKKIAQGNFSYIPVKSHSFALIVEAFNRMIKELELRQEQLLQERKLAAVGTLTSGIAHELNNPLNNISLTVESLIEELDELNKEESIEMLHEVLGEVERASSLVKNLLEFSRRKKSQAFELINLADIIEVTIRLVQNQLTLSNIRLKKHIPENIPKINGNSDSLKQVFVNLFFNAIQAMPEGGSLTVVVSQGARGFVSVQVADTGVGIPRDVMDRIFDPFYTTKPVGIGTGLGLSIVYGIVKKHGGHIEVQSEQGKGTTFTVFLPAVEEG
jgi:signal transduction histidine kinase